MSLHGRDCNDGRKIKNEKNFKKNTRSWSTTVLAAAVHDAYVAHGRRACVERKETAERVRGRVPRPADRAAPDPTLVSRYAVVPSPGPVSVRDATEWDTFAGIASRQDSDCAIQNVAGPHAWRSPRLQPSPPFAQRRESPRDVRAFINTRTGRTRSFDEVRRARSNSAVGSVGNR